MKHVLRPAVLLVWLFMLASCQHTQERPTANLVPSARPADSQAASETTKPLPSPLAYEPLLPRTATLGGIPGEVLPSTAEEGDLLETVHTLMAQRNPVQPKSEPRLHLAAREVSRCYAQFQKVPSSTLRTRMLEWAGVAEPMVEYFHFSKWPEDPTEERDAALQQWLDEIATRGPVSHMDVGIHRLEREGKHPVEYLTVLALRRTLDLEPVRWKVDIAERIFIKGRISTKATRPETNTKERYHLYLQFLDEAVFDAPVPIQAGTFSVEVQIPQAHAAYTAELVRVRDKQAAPVARLVFYYKSEPPRRFFETPPQPACKDLPTCETRLHTIIDQARAKAGRESLRLDPAMVTQARTKAEDMILHHYSSIVDLKGDRLDDRLRRAGQPCLQAGEIIDGDYHLEAIVQRLKSNPALTNFVQNPSFTDQGCGLASKTDRQGRTYYAMSCGLATFMDRTPIDQLPDTILERINAKRGENKLPWLKLRKEGNKLARYAVRELWRNLENHRAVQQKVMSSIEQGAIPGKNFQFGLFTLYSLHQLTEKPTAQDLFTSPANSLTLGVLRVTKPEEHPKGIFVYYILYDAIQRKGKREARAY